MINEIKELTRLRKYFLLYQFFTKATNVFLIAITIKLISTMFGDFGLILKDYAVPLIGLLIFLPYISGYIIDHPLKCFTVVVALEILSIVGYSLAELGFYPEITLVFSIFVLTASNTVVAPLRAKNTSEVIGGCKSYSILSERLNAVSMALLTLVGIALLTYGIPTTLNIVLSVICLLASRLVYVVVLKELGLNKTT